MYLKKEKLFRLILVLSLMLLAISFVGCGSSKKEQELPKDTGPTGEISHFLGSWKSVDISPEVRFTINNQILGKEVIDYETYTDTEYYYSGSITCDVLGGTVIVSEKPDSILGGNSIIINEISTQPGSYGLQINAGDSNNGLLIMFLSMPEEEKLLGGGNIYQEGEAIVVLNGFVEFIRE